MHQLRLAEDDDIQLLLRHEVADAVLLPLLVEAPDVLVEEGDLQAPILLSISAALSGGVDLSDLTHCTCIGSHLGLLLSLALACQDLSALGVTKIPRCELPLPQGVLWVRSQ